MATPAAAPLPAETPVTPRPEPKPLPEAADSFTDPQILGIVDQACGKLVVESTLARSNALSPEVRSFAGDMAADYAAYRERQDALGKRIEMSPAPSDTRLMIGVGTENDMLSLMRLDATVFDKAFLAQVVADHDYLIDLLEGRLLDDIDRSEIRALIESDLRDKLTKNRARARELDAGTTKDIAREVPAPYQHWPRPPR
ncbi:MAG: DUF4142 domain-containing protein [Polyangiaceae bacterium]|nr:DUF4142 domain-containing protein [Polyangiaceae bacterium]